MIVNKIGRPSKTAERTTQILSAARAVVSREGIEATTLSAVAEEAGLQRTLVLHYFRTREALIEAFVTRTIDDYGRQMLTRGASSPISERINRLFDAGAYRSRADLVVWTELAALAARDAEVRKQLQHLWTDSWLPELERQLAEEFTGARREQIEAAAYALAGLFEAHWWFHVQGVTGRKRQTQARYAAALILSDLKAPHPAGP